MKDEQILAGAPEGAESISPVGHYIKAPFNNVFFYSGSEWLRTDPTILCYSRSLTDIARIVELEMYLSSSNKALHAVIGIPASVGICEPIEGYEAAPSFLPSAIKGMANKITELEKERDDLRYIVDVSCEAHNLEQQAKGLTIALGMGLHASKLERIIIKINELQNQAKQLREGK